MTLFCFFFRIENKEQTMRGGRQFSRRPRDGDYGGKFRPSNSSFRDNSSGGRFNDQANGRRFKGSTDNFVKNSSSARNRSRYDRRSPSNRFLQRVWVFH